MSYSQNPVVCKNLMHFNFCLTDYTLKNLVEVQCPVSPGGRLATVADVESWGTSQRAFKTEGFRLRRTQENSVSLKVLDPGSRRYGVNMVWKQSPGVHALNVEYAGSQGTVEVGVEIIESQQTRVSLAATRYSPFIVPKKGPILVGPSDPCVLGVVEGAMQFYTALGGRRVDITHQHFQKALSKDWDLSNGAIKLAHTSVSPDEEFQDVFEIILDVGGNKNRGALRTTYRQLGILSQEGTPCALIVEAATRVLFE